MNKGGIETMANPITDFPKGTRGAFVEHTQNKPRLVLPFQFNPVQLQRSRSLSYSVAGQPKNDFSGDATEKSRQRAKDLGQSALQELHQNQGNLDLLRKAQLVQVQEESISLEIRLDATDRLSVGDHDAEQFGVAPQLAILEQMIYPEDQTMLGKQRAQLAQQSDKYSYTKSPNPPVILFVWGKRPAVPVNINSMNITESEFNIDLYPIRVTVAVQLTVIEGANTLFKDAMKWRESLAMKALNSGPPGIGQVAEVKIPG
jgi:hypothetical protein